MSGNLRVFVHVFPAAKQGVCVFNCFQFWAYLCILKVRLSLPPARKQRGQRSSVTDCLPASMDVNSSATPILNASSQLHMHDVLFHVIFGCNTASIYELVHASAVRLHSITRCPFLASTMQTILQEAADANRQVCLPGNTQASQQRTTAHGPDVIRALFFLFLNVDCVLKDYVCNPGNRKYFAAAMNIRKPLATSGTPDQAQALAKLHSWSMLCTRPLDPGKARRFFYILRNSIVKVWMQDERLHASDLLQMIKEEYLVS